MLIDVIGRMHLAYPFPQGTPPIGWLEELTLEELSRRPICVLRDYAIAADLEAYRIVGSLTMLYNDIEDYEARLAQIARTEDASAYVIVTALLEKKRATMADYLGRKQRLQEHQHRLRMLLEVRLPPELRGSRYERWERPLPN